MCCLEADVAPRDSGITSAAEVDPDVLAGLLDRSQKREEYT